jgi:hypothetical protein
MNLGLHKTVPNSNDTAPYYQYLSVCRSINQSVTGMAEMDDLKISF